MAELGHQPIPNALLAGLHRVKKTTLVDRIDAAKNILFFPQNLNIPDTGARHLTRRTPWRKALIWVRPAPVTNRKTAK